MQEILIKHVQDKLSRQEKQLLTQLNDICCSHEIELIEEVVSMESLTLPLTYINGELKLTGSFPSFKDLSFWLDVDLVELLENGCACGSGGCQCH